MSDETVQQTAAMVVTSPENFHLTGFQKTVLGSFGGTLTALGALLTSTTLGNSSAASPWYSWGWPVLGILAAAALFTCLVGFRSRGQMRHICLGGGTGVLAGVAALSVVAGIMVYFTVTQPTGAAAPVPDTSLASLQLDPATGKIMLEDSWCTLFVSSDADRDSLSTNLAERLPDGLEIASVTSVSNRANHATVSDSAVTVEGSYGRLTVSPDGAYTFAMTDKAAAAGEMESFTLEMLTTNGHTATIDLHFTFATYKEGGWEGDVYRWIISGTSARDIINGSSHIDEVSAGAGDDSIKGGDANDEIYGEDGDDIISGGLGDNYLDGGSGNDTLYAGSPSEFGIGGKSVLVGGKGDDLLVGNAVGSVLMGGDGRDTLVSTYNNDRLTGDAGADTFVLGKAAANVANIVDFNMSEGDVLDITLHVPEGPEATLEEIRAAVRFAREDDSTLVYVPGDYGGEKQVAKLQGALVDLDTLFGLGGLKSNGTELEGCGC